MKRAIDPIEVLKLHPITVRALRRRGVLTVGQLAALSSGDLRRAGTSRQSIARIEYALGAHGLALAPSRRGQRPKKGAAAAKPASAAAPAAKPAAAPPPAPPAPAIPQLPRLGRVEVRLQAPPPRTWSWAAPAAPLAAVRSYAQRAATWARSHIGAALLRIGERVAP